VISKREILDGGKSGLKEEKSQGANYKKVSIHFFMYVCGFQWQQLRTSMGCSGNNCVHMSVVVGIVVYMRVVVEKIAYLHGFH
jgi:hypothetical protein